jgi:hypothetical protein
MLIGRIGKKLEVINPSWKIAYFVLSMATWNLKKPNRPIRRHLNYFMPRLIVLFLDESGLESASDAKQSNITELKKQERRESRKKPFQDCFCLGSGYNAWRIGCRRRHFF